MPDVTKLPKPYFKVGEILTAAKLETLSDMIRRQVMLPGSFQNGAFSIQAVSRRGGGGGVVSGTLNRRMARVHNADILGAGGPNIGLWGFGEVELQDPDTGDLTGEYREALNEWIGVGWVENAQVEVEGAFSEEGTGAGTGTGGTGGTGGDFGPVRIKNGTCDAVDWGF